MNQSKGHLPFLDGIRGIAILAVFLYHSFSATFGFDNLPWNGMFRNFDASRSFLALYPLSYGSAGVAIFFVVSEFCIHLSHQRSHEGGWLNFFNRRFFRLYPPYLLAILVFFFLWPWGSFTISSWPKLVHLVTHILAIHNLNQSTFYTINPSLWSVAVEIQLYAIYPILLFIISKKGWQKGLMITAICEVLIRSASYYSSAYLNDPMPRYISASPFAYWFSWSIGAFLAQCFLEGRNSFLSKIRFDIVAVIAFAMHFFKPALGLKFLAFSLLTAIAIDRLISEKWEIPKNKLFNIAWKHLSSLGLVSYSFYLFHQPFLVFTSQLFKKYSMDMNLHPLLKFSIYCAWYPVILMLSYFIYRTIEKPSIEIGKRVWNKIKKANPKIQTVPAAD